MRTALFFDGKNFYSGWKDRAAGRRIRFGRMADWLVKQVGGTSLWGAYYYTGIDTGSGITVDGQKRLASFLHMLELEPGYFVRRFPRKAKVLRCKSCSAENRYSTDGEMDVALVSDMLRMAAQDCFDHAILVSGDADHAPAIEAVRALGKQLTLAGWGSNVGSRIRNAAAGHVDLARGISQFEDQEIGVHTTVVAGTLQRADGSTAPAEGSASPLPPVHSDDPAAVFMDELRRAEIKFHGGYLGLNYFVTRWRSDRLDTSPDVRRRLLDRLATEGKVEVYSAPDGTKAIKEKI